MSWQATAHVVELERCPDGAPINGLQIGFLLTLANYHNAEQLVAFPSVLTLARKSRQSESQTKRHIKYFCEHGVLDVRSKRGRGHFAEYKFVALDGRFDGSKTGLLEPFFSPSENRSERVQKKQQKGSKRVQASTCNKEESENLKEPENSVRESANADPRHALLRAAVERLQISAHGFTTWSTGADNQLQKLLRARQGLAIETLVDCLVYRWLSPNANLADDPRHYVGKITDWADGPINRFRDRLQFDGEDFRRLRAIASGVESPQVEMPLEPAPIRERAVEIVIPNPAAAQWNGTPASSAWSQILHKLENGIARHTFETWLKPTRALDAAGDALRVLVPTPEFLAIADRFREAIVHAVIELGLPCSRVTLVVQGGAQ
jgi:hypothetical protein